MGLVVVPTYIGDIGCSSDGSVFMKIHFEIEGKAADLTVSMTNHKAMIVQKTIKKAAKQGVTWLETGVPPNGNGI